jgi:hypothetical protein
MLSKNAENLFKKTRFFNQNACVSVLPVVFCRYALARKSEGNAAQAATIHRLVRYRVSAGASGRRFQGK